MRKRSATALATLAALSLAAAIPSAAFASSDLEGHWSREQVEALIASGVVKGYPDGTFRPDDFISRAELTALINRAARLNELAHSDAFSDVHEGDWYDGHVAAAVLAAYVKGYEDGTFLPDRKITRNEAAVMVARALGIENAEAPELSFTDKDEIPDWAAKAVAAVAAAGYLEGYPDGSFRGEQEITRAESAVLIERVLDQLVESVPRPVTVTVTDGEDAVSGARVRAHMDGRKAFIASSVTDEEGEVLFSLRPGSYELTAAAEDMVGTFKVEVETSESDVDLTMAQGAVLEGVVLDHEGNLMAGAVVMFTTNPTFMGTTDDEGRYSIVLSAEHEYEMTLVYSDELSQAILGGAALDDLMLDAERNALLLAVDEEEPAEGIYPFAEKIAVNETGVLDNGTATIGENGETQLESDLVVDTEKPGSEEPGEPGDGEEPGSEEPDEPGDGETGNHA